MGYVSLQEEDRAPSAKDGGADPDVAETASFYRPRLPPTRLPVHDRGSHLWSFVTARCARSRSSSSKSAAAFSTMRTICARLSRSAAEISLAVEHLVADGERFWQPLQLHAAHQMADDALGQQHEQAQRLEQGHDPGIAERQRRGTLAVDDTGTVDLLEDRLGEVAVLTDALHLQHAAVGGKADGPQRGQVAQASAEALFAKSRVSLMVVSVRRARSSLKYCLMRLDL
jgi:hypothetical protein